MGVLLEIVYANRRISELISSPHSSVFVLQISSESSNPSTHL